MKTLRNTTLIATGLLGLFALVAVPASADIIHADDVIAQFSMCIGNDCVNGESFGFDTLRLKENNVRIDFRDTSTSASFPSNDWGIVINDSSNGGGNYFAVEDRSAGRIPFRIEASAPANSLYVDDGGRIGLGTATPVVELHVVNGDTPTLRLEQNGSSGFTPQTWDLAGNETNIFIRDATNGSQLPFRITPGADTNSLFIASDNEVGIGTNSPGADLHVLAGGSSFAFNSATVMALQNNAGTADGMIFALMGGATGNAQLTFGDSGDFAKGRLRFNNADSSFEFDTAGANRVRIDSTGLTTTSGGACTAVPCDGTFDPELYDVESIDEHAEYMWENQHLWGVGPTPEDAPINVTHKLTGVLHELEKAHIYIEQLHQRLNEERSLSEQLVQRVEALEAAVAD